MSTESDRPNLADMADRIRNIHRQATELLIDVRSTAPEQATSIVRFLKSATYALSSAADAAAGLLGDQPEPVVLVAGEPR